MPDGRTVSEIMSHPVVTATSGETVAVAAARMRRAGCGFCHRRRRRAAGRHPHRARPGALRRRRSGARGRHRQRVDDPRPRLRRARRTGQDAFASLAEHGYRHIPVVEEGRLVGVVSMRDLMRIAQIQPVERSRTRSRRARGRHRRRDVDRRRARARGLLPLPPVRRRSSSPRLARSRTCGTCCSRASCRRIAERSRVPRRGRPTARDSGRGAGRAPRSRRRRVRRAVARPAAHDGLVARRVPRLPALARRRRPTSSAPTRCGSARSSRR